MKTLFQIFRDGDAGGAAGGGAAPAAASGGTPAAAPAASLAAAAAAAVGSQGGDGQPNGQQQPNGQGAPNGQQAPVNGAYFPEGLPDEFKGANERETIDKLAAKLTGLPKPPASPKDYKFELSPEMKDKFGDLKDDKFMPLWAETAHELDLDDGRATAALEKLYQKMDKAGLIDRGPDYTAEMQKLMPKSGNTREQLVAVQARINGAQAFIQGLETNGALTKDLAAILHANTDTASGVMLMEALQKAMGGTGLQGGGVPPAIYSDADWRRDMNDERYSTSSPKHDPEFRRSVDDKASKLPRKKLSADGRVV
jgi:hypothetical protein